ncbi:hypothetical protein D3C81_1582620 [compost metagenome]
MQHRRFIGEKVFEREVWTVRTDYRFVFRNQRLEPVSRLMIVQRPHGLQRVEAYAGRSQAVVQHHRQVERRVVERFNHRRGRHEPRNRT